MLLKWIICDVPSDKREAFSAAQQRWQSIDSLPGFLGQVGGWNAKRASDACILGLWADGESYECFMRQHHDAIFKNSGQQDTYQSSSVRLVDAMFEIEGAHRGILSALADGQVLRVADCMVAPGRRDHFIEMQRTLWNPAMAATGGMLAGAFGPMREERDRFLTVTLWDDPAVHRKYVETILPSLQKQAGLEEDLRRIQGYVVALETAWRVASSPQGG